MDTCKFVFTKYSTVKIPSKTKYFRLKNTNFTWGKNKRTNVNTLVRDWFGYKEQKTLL